MYFDKDPKVLAQDILRDIQAAAQQQNFPGLALIPLATLLVKVSEEASETISDLKVHITELNNKNSKLQFIVAALAVISIMGSAIQIWYGVKADKRSEIVDVKATESCKAQLQTPSPASSTPKSK